MKYLKLFENYNERQNLPSFFFHTTPVKNLKSITKNGTDYLPGDIVCWNFGGAITHIGLVVNKKSDDGTHYLVVHNIGAVQVLADCLFDFKIIGHYSFQK